MFIIKEGQVSVSQSGCTDRVLANQGYVPFLAIHINECVPLSFASHPYLQHSYAMCHVINNIECVILRRERVISMYAYIHEQSSRGLISANYFC